MRMNRSRGFTMTELMMVIVILGILFSLVPVSVAGYISRTKLRTSAYELDAAIRRVRWLAVSRSEVSSIRFNTSDNSYILNGTERTTLPAGLRFGVSSNVAGCPGAPGQIPPADGISFGSSASPETLTCYSNGEVVPAGTVYITDGQKTMAIRVSSVGRPRMWRSNETGQWIDL